MAAQQSAFDHFIDGAACLRRQRGRVMSRNSCRTPWMSFTNVAIRQALPTSATQSFALELQVLNFLNLLIPVGTGSVADRRDADEHESVRCFTVGEVTRQAQPIYRFDPVMPRYSYDNFDTYYQIQLAVRYIF